MRKFNEKGGNTENPTYYFRNRNAQNLGVFKIHKFLGSSYSFKNSISLSG